MTSASSPYDATLAELATRLPRLAAALQRAEQHRARSATSRMGGARFKGLDELLRHLDELLLAFTANPTLCRLDFLIHRSRADLETATEATLSGYVAVAGDSMRDIMEIEDLLLDFAVNPAHIDEWLTADWKTLLGKFSAARVRARLHAAGEGLYSTTAESLGYRAHSTAIHVGPHRHPSPLVARGFVTDQWASDSGFWEIFEHARRLLHAIQRVTDALTPGSAVDDIARQELADFQDAWRQTWEMQWIYVAMLKAIEKTQTEESDQHDLPT
ncbi:MAG: hypothetical protein ACRDRT_02200 [Pseudonocardiaceae bacterium]